jgi:hypothetical protein
VGLDDGGDVGIGETAPPVVQPVRCSCCSCWEGGLVRAWPYSWFEPSGA